MNMFNTFLQNGAAPDWVYQLASFIGIIIIPLAILDVGLKGWGMWRAAKMGKNIWFIVLLVVNSFGILPAIFLLLTNDEYVKRRSHV